MPACEIVFRLYSITTSMSFARDRLADFAYDSQNRIVEVIYHAFLQWDDGVIGDVNVLGAHFRAALRDVATPDTHFILQQFRARHRIERMHLQARHAHEEPRPGKLGFPVVVAQYVAHVLAQEALDALTELLHAVDVPLIHLPV